MPEYLDKLNEKKERLKREQEASKTLSEIKNISSEVARQGAKNRTSTQEVNVKNQVDMGEVIDSVNKLNLTTFLSSNSKYVDSIDELHEMSGHLAKLAEILTKSSSGLDQTLSEYINKIKNLSSELRDLEIKRSDDLAAEIKNLTSAIKKMAQPEVHVAAPEVVVQPSEAPNVTVDTKPISELLNSYLSQKKPLLLDGFKALDMDDDSGTMQYVSFMNPDGCWYIVENDIEGCSLRYKFGTKNYRSAWRSRVNLGYKLLNEAIDEIRS